MERRTLFALVTLLALLGAAGVAGAQTNDTEQDDDKHGHDKAQDARKDSSKGKSDDKRRDVEDDDRRGKNGHGKPEFAKKGDKWEFHNDQIAVWFHQTGSGKASPDLKVFVNGTDGNKSGYRVKLLSVYETDDANGSKSGKMNRINLAKSQDWNIQTQETNDSVTLTMVHAEAQGIITLVWHLNKSTAEVKFDTLIDNWRWADNATGHKLVLDMLVKGKNLKNETGAKVSVGDAGYITWATTADATYADGNTTTMNVRAIQKAGGDDDDDDDDDKDDDSSGTHLLLVFDGQSGYDALVYDPSFGVMSAGEPKPVTAVPGFGLIGLFVAGVAAIALRRRA